ncbi:alanine--tRNA ligase [Saccharophagus sp. K07]|uniref:alanine--tRNA ligase n=1 Tax=Saccharophagus sp. K07 TaxID=2283636 RepID=UPI0016528417|nr:alanine--tRNA ligase [Saccharophagus sp. K07]MBC6904734.1 alanine--tRNA ligase [Saccharophagus sp. K07]
MKSADIREAFLSFFSKHGHTVVPSSSLIPGNDPTLLFTNSGMVQFKDVFLGSDKRAYTRATSAQRCVRAGGKHNDLENVGYTARHHTFFEMLGNFSFGDYFKRDAIKFAWEFLTQVLHLPPERLWVTVHISDDEAADIWIKEVGIDPTRFSRLDADNFWQMGDTGPCGPSSEIFYDHGPNVPGGPPGSPDDGLDRYIEIWNLVFMQFERQPSGELIPLPKPSVDTGMGLERIAAVLQGVHSNYEIDLFQALLRAAASVTGCQDLEEKSLRVIADHIRSCSFLIADGVLPSNEGRGYVLRRIIRRAIRHGHKLGQDKPFFHKLVASLVEQMGDAYPDLAAQKAHIEKILLSEEEQFAKTLDKGLAVLASKLESQTGTVIPGDVVFTLYDTYGFPVDLTNDIARERGLTLDMDGYEALMEQQRERARSAGAFKVDYTAGLELEGETGFRGYESLECETSVAALARGKFQVDRLAEGEEGVVVLAETPFYAESGGQIGDCGYIESASGRFEVLDCRKEGSHHLHIGRVTRGELVLNAQVTAVVETGLRQATALNHSATHLLHAALRQVLGTHVTQKGSLVDSQRLRFDFTHFEAVSAEQLQEIENIVNEQIRLNTEVKTEILDIETAKKKGAMALFGEKYGDKVRVLTMGEGFSIELCGGTHAKRTGDIGLFRIVSESGIAAGVRRIEAVTGAGAFEYMAQAQKKLLAASQMLKTAPDALLEKLDALLNQNRQLEKELTQIKGKLAAASIDEWIAEAEDFKGIRLLVKQVPGNDAKLLRDLVDKLRNKLGNSAVLLAGTDGERVNLVAGVSKEATALVKAGDMVRVVAEKIGAKGGGRPDMAQGGGADNGHLPEALTALKEWLRQA